MKEKINISEGSGGREMQKLIDSFREIFTVKSDWTEKDNDSAVFDLGNGKLLCFTTDSYIVDPIFFPGGNIGHIAACGTINDLSVMGAQPIGLSLSLIIEEGFSKDNLKKIISSINEISKKTNIPIVTGDTKVMEKNKVDKIIINTAGVGLVNKNELLNKTPKKGDKIIVSGNLGDHTIALLSKRFDYDTEVITDSKPIIEEITKIKSKIKIAKDPTRGGLAASLNEISEKYKIGIEINEEDIPTHKESKIVTEILGLNIYQLACEGRFICICSNESAQKVLSTLKEYNQNSSIIGEITEKEGVFIKTKIGKRILTNPTGKLVPRIC